MTEEGKPNHPPLHDDFPWLGPVLLALSLGLLAEAAHYWWPRTLDDAFVTFRYARNPIYVGNTLLVAGAGLVFGVAWLVPAALAGAWATEKLAIAREEAHLALRFGPAWQAYASRTPRWLFRAQP